MKSHSSWSNCWHAIKQLSSLRRCETPKILYTRVYGYKLRTAPGILDGFDSVFSGKSSHKQCQLTVSCRLDGSPVNPLYEFSGESTATVHSYNKFDVFHGLSCLHFTTAFTNSLFRVGPCSPVSHELRSPLVIFPGLTRSWHLHFCDVNRILVRVGVSVHS